MASTTATAQAAVQMEGEVPRSTEERMLGYEEEHLVDAPRAQDDQAPHATQLGADAGSGHVMLQS